MITVQKRFREPEFREEPFLEVRIRRTKIGDLEEGDKLELMVLKNGNILLCKKENMVYKPKERT